MRPDLSASPSPSKWRFAPDSEAAIAPLAHCSKRRRHVQVDDNWLSSDCLPGKSGNARCTCEPAFCKRPLKDVRRDQFSPISQVKRRRSDGYTMAVITIVLKAAATARIAGPQTSTETSATIASAARRRRVGASCFAHVTSCQRASTDAPRRLPAASLRIVFLLIRSQNCKPPPYVEITIRASIPITNQGITNIGRSRRRSSLKCSSATALLRNLPLMRRAVMLANVIVFFSSSFRHTGANT